MAITGDYKIAQQYNPYNFLTLSAGQGQQVQTGTSNYHQASQGMPSTLPTTVQWGLPSIEDMELAQKIATSGVGSVTNPFQTSAIGEEKAYVPTGTGELSPVVEGREDEIEGCPWKEYYA